MHTHNHAHCLVSTSLPQRGHIMYISYLHACTGDGAVKTTNKARGQVIKRNGGEGARNLVVARDRRGKVRRTPEAKRGEEESLCLDERENKQNGSSVNRHTIGERNNLPYTLLTSRFVTKSERKRVRDGPSQKRGSGAAGTTPAVTLVATRNKLTLKKGAFVPRFPPSVHSKCSRLGDGRPPGWAAVRGSASSDQ